MTDEEKTKEGSRNIIVPTCITVTTITPTAIATAPQTIVTFDSRYLERTGTPVPTLNFSLGNAAFCLDAIVRNKDLMESRGRIRKERKLGCSISEMIKEQKGAFSAGIAFNTGICEIGKTVFDIVNTHTTNTR